MNSIKIEKSAILELKRIICLHGKINDFLNEDDKENHLRKSQVKKFVGIGI